MIIVLTTTTQSSAAVPPYLNWTLSHCFCSLMWLQSLKGRFVQSPEETMLRSCDSNVPERRRSYNMIILWLMITAVTPAPSYYKPRRQSPAEDNGQRCRRNAKLPLILIKMWQSPAGNSKNRVGLDSVEYSQVRGRDFPLTFTESSASLGPVHVSHRGL